MSKKKAKKIEEELSALVDWLGSTKEYMKSTEAKIKEVNDKILILLKDVDNLEYEGEDYKAKIVQRNSINYDAYKIDEKLDNPLTKQFIVKDYMITDFKGFQEVLKNAGIKFKDIKEFIVVNKKVNVAELDKLAKQEIIGPKDLKGCFILSQSEYIKINKKKKE